MVQFPHGVYLYIYIAIPKKMPKKQIFTVGLTFRFFETTQWILVIRMLGEFWLKQPCFFFPGEIELAVCFMKSCSIPILWLVYIHVFYFS